MFDVIKQDLAALEEAMIATVQSPVAIITEIGTHLVQSGGKRLRPALYFLAARGGVSFDRDKVMPLAVAIEMIHMASLVHDDVIDSADLRRGTATANSKWGNQLAILGGDYLFAKAFSLVAGNGYDDRITMRLSQLICDLSAGGLFKIKRFTRLRVMKRNTMIALPKKRPIFSPIAAKWVAFSQGFQKLKRRLYMNMGRLSAWPFRLRMICLI